MKDFIEVTRENGLKRLVNINKIYMVEENIIHMDDDYYFHCKETYEEIKEKIRIAQEGEVILRVKED